MWIGKRPRRYTITVVEDDGYDLIRPTAPVPSHDERPMMDAIQAYIAWRERMGEGEVQE